MKIWKILVADDEEDMREALKLSFESHFKCQISLADCAQSAIGLLRQFQFDLVVSDMNMGKDSGLDIFKFLKCKENSPPVVFFSGTSFDFLDGAIVPPIVALIAKPNYDELMSCVREQLAKIA